MSAAVTAIVISYADPAATRAAVCSLLEQTIAPVEALVVDNDPAGVALAVLAAEPRLCRVRAIHPKVNLGYTRAANLAASEAVGEWLFFLNPDVLAERDCLEQMLSAVDGSDVGVVGAQVLFADGRVNAGDNPIGIAGFSWAGGCGRARERGPARDTAAVSGAWLMVRREDYLVLGGLCPDFFMYFDDADLAWRMWLSGRRVRYCPEAVVVHDYEFDKGAHKWFYLERNRVWSLIGNLQLRTLLLLAPVRVAAEVAVWMLAIRPALGRGEGACLGLAGGAFAAFDGLAAGGADAAERFRLSGHC